MTTLLGRTPRAVASRYMPAALFFVAFLALWEMMVVVFDIKGFLLPKPSVIAQAYVADQRVVWEAGWVTLQEALGGFFIGVVGGGIAALATARWTMLRESALPFAIAINSAPIVALAPIFNSWFGSTNPVSKMAVVAVMVFFPVMINMVRGLTEVQLREIELLRSYAATPRELLLKVRFPNSLPYLFNALKVGSALAMIGAIVAEYFAGPNRALGVYISQKAAGAKFAEAWAAVIVGSAMGIALYLIVTLAERRAMPWHESRRSRP